MTAEIPPSVKPVERAAYVLMLVQNSADEPGAEDMTEGARRILAAALSDEDEAMAVLAVPCGRCSGKGTERHTVLAGDEADTGEHRCPSCLGSGQGFAHRTPAEAFAALRAYLLGET